MFGNGKGLFGSTPIAMAPAMQPATKGPQQGGFGGFLQRNQMPLAQISDVLLRYAGGRGNPVLQRLQDRQDMEQMQGYRTQMAKQQREAEQQDWLARQQWERANPAPVEPTAMQRNYEWLRTTNPTIADDYLAAQARDPNDETVSVTIPNVGTYVGPRSGMAQAFGGQQDGNRPAIGSTIQLGGAATTRNTPPPQLNADGFPSVITRQQYDALVNESDGNRAAVDAFIARRRIQVRN